MFLGVVILPILPLGFSFGIELTFPVSEAMSIGIMALASNVISFGVTYAATYLTEEFDGTSGSLASIGLLSGMMLFAVIMCIFIKEDLRRLNAGTNLVTSMFSFATMGAVVQPAFGKSRRSTMK